MFDRWDAKVLSADAASAKHAVIFSGLLDSPSLEFKSNELLLFGTFLFFGVTLVAAAALDFDFLTDSFFGGFASSSDSSV